MSKNTVLPVVLVAAIGAGLSTSANAGFRVIEPAPAPAQQSAAVGSVVQPAQNPLQATQTIAAATPAKAGFVPFDGSDLASPKDARPSSGFGLVAVTYVGNPNGQIEVRNGMGRGVQLSDALRQIAPNGWRGFGRMEAAGTFNGSKRVNWKGGRPWTEVLDILANEEDFAVEVDWNRKHLYIGNREYKGTSIASVTPRPVAPPPKPVWTAKVGGTVRSTMDEWAKKEGWTLVWPMADLDYRIAAPLSFDGSLVDATSKLTRLYETAERPLAVDIHPSQKLIVFSEQGNAQ